MSEKPKDHRINLFRMADLDMTDSYTYFTEHEVEAECQISGIAQFKNIEFRPWSFDDGIKPGDRRLFFLRFPGRSWGVEGPDFLEDYEHGFHSGMSDREEFLVLASVFLRRRLSLRATTKTDQSPMRQEHHHKIYDELTVDGANLTGLPAFLGQVEGLTPEHQHAYLLACRFYHLGLSLSDQDPELAYLAHVSALEVLAHRIKIEHKSEEAIDPEVYAGIITIPDKALRDKTIRKLADSGKPTAWFRKLITGLTHDSFFRTDLPSWQVVITRENLECTARNVYLARSKALHSGAPFPDRLLEHRNRAPEEFSLGIPQHQGKGMPKGKELDTDPCKNKNRIPNLPAFERLTNHILTRFLATRTREPQNP